MKYKNYNFKVTKCCTDSDYIKTYTSTSQNSICPFCESNLIFRIREVKGIDNKLSGKITDYVCETCGILIGIAFYGLGISFNEIVDREIKEYNLWKCNINRSVIKKYEINTI